MRELVEGKKGVAESTSLVEALLPSEGLRLSVVENWQTLSTGFSIIWTEPSSRFIDFLREQYPDLSGSFPGGLVLKSCGRKENERFHNNGMVGEQTLALEAEVDLRQASVGMPSCFGIAYFSGDADQVVLSRDKVSGSEPVVIMPRFPKSSLLSDLYASGPVPRALEQNTARQLMRRLFSMKRQVPIETAVEYCSGPGTLALIRDERMLRFEKEDTIFSKQAEFVNRALEAALDDPEMEAFLLSEIGVGRVGEQHGDARAFDNLHFVRRTDGGFEAFIRDPVRLSQRTPHGPKLNQEWFVTHDDLQVGMLIGAPFADSTYKGFTRNVIEAYAAFSGSNHALFDHPLRVKLFGLGIAYGVSVGLHVQNYDRTDLSFRLDGLSRSDSGQGAADLEAQLSERVKLMDRYWDTLTFLADTEFAGWREGF